MNNTFKTVLGLMIPFLGTSAGALPVLFMNRDFGPRLKKFLFGFAAGVMIAASVWSLLIPAIEMTGGRLAFLPAVFIIYRLLPGIRSRNVFLALSSLVFYAFGQLVYLPLFLASILINYISGLLLSGKCRRSRLILTLAVVLNLGILCVLK